MRFETRVEGKPARDRLTDGEGRVVTETCRTIAPRDRGPPGGNVFSPISMPIVSTRAALIDVAWDVLLALLISQREVTPHRVGAQASPHSSDWAYPQPPNA